LLNSVEVTSISVSGEGGLRGVVISGKIQTWNKSKTPLHTPRIVFESTKIGIEIDVQGQVELADEEAYKYLFDNKKMNKDLFDPVDDDTKEPVKEEA